MKYGILLNDKDFSFQPNSDFMKLDLFREK